MVVEYLRKACLMTVVACLFIAPVQADEGNPENDPEGQTNQGIWPPPCDYLYVGTQEPYVDPHLNCITDTILP